jgi:hypothetical protein
LGNNIVFFQRIKRKHGYVIPLRGFQFAARIKESAPQLLVVVQM